MNSSPENFEYISRLKFASTLRYSTQHKPEDLLEDNYFHNSGTQYLEPGDEIDVVCFAEDGSYTKGRLEVIKQDRIKTVVQQLGTWRSSDKKDARKMMAVHRGFGKWSVVDENGKDIASNLTKSEAEVMSPTPKKPKATKPKKLDTSRLI
jgi:hypothetical protein